ncbi:MAG: hypothetical protein ABUK01_05090 [Leptospirales bacterium]
MKTIKTITLGMIIAISACTNNPVISDFGNDRVTLVLKGTYESNTPYGWDTNLNTSESIFTGYAGEVFDTQEASADIGFYIDIANIRIGRKNAVPAGTSDLDYWELFAENRVVLCDSNTDVIGNNLVNCAYGNGTYKLNQFFKEGFEYPVEDIPAGRYQHIGVYFRKFITFPAVLYDSSYNEQEVLTSIFDNRTVYGYDLNSQLLQYANSDSGEDNPLMIPLEATNLNLKVTDSYVPYVIEIRIFIKNQMMKHVIKYGTNTSAEKPLTFIGPADWRTDHAYSGRVSGFHLGKHLLMTARLYEPDNVGSLYITEASVPSGTATEYYTIVKSGNTLTAKTLPYAATQIIDVGGASGEGTITNLPPGNYKLYKTCDAFYRDSTGEIAGNDGFPESIDDLSGVTVTITKNNTTTQAITSNGTCP